MYKRFTMQENLVIVESPAKAKTIEKFLGKDFMVKSSFGHIRDLSKKDLGINLADGFAPVYEIPKDKRKVVDELTRAAKDRTVWLASDEDREGEAIAWHLTEVLGLPVDRTKRIVFHEITKRAILEAIEKPRTVNMDLVNAQQARRILDRLVGFELSPVLWKKVRPALSAGRVQSVAVRLIVEREREIIHRRIANIAADIDKRHGVRTDVGIGRGYPCVVNDEILVKRAVALAQETGLKVEMLPLRTTAEDFGFYCRVYPSLFYRLGVGAAAGRPHTSSFSPDEGAIDAGIGFMGRLALQILNRQ